MNGRRITVKVLFASLLAVLLLSATTPAQSATIQYATKLVQPSESTADTPVVTRPPSRELKIPAGTALEIEAVYTVSSVDMRPGDVLSFHVLIPVKIDDVIVIDKYSLVTGRVVEARRGGHWGKAGRLSWIMQDVVATDLTRVPLQAQRDLPTGRNGIRGTGHGGEVVAKTIVFGALLFPLSPLALMSGFKRGDNAVLPQGKRFVVFVQSDTTVKTSGR
jgi:hypothetical protein